MGHWALTAPSPPRNRGDHPARGVLGAGKGNLDEDLVAWGKALQAPNVCGLVIGRSLLFPADGDVATAVDKTVQLLK